MAIQDDYFDLLDSLSGEEKKTFKGFAAWAFDMEEERDKAVAVQKAIQTVLKAVYPKIIIGYKLMRKRRDGTYGSLFINRKDKLYPDTWLLAESHRTRGYQFRPGWHLLPKPVAPHLSKKGRVWVRVAALDVETHIRPESQGGKWLLAQQIKILEQVT